MYEESKYNQNAPFNPNKTNDLNKIEKNRQKQAANDDYNSDAIGMKRSHSAQENASLPKIQQTISPSIP